MITKSGKEWEEWGRGVVVSMPRNVNEKSLMVSYLSTRLTGSDQWRVSHESDGHVETDYAAPGEYSDITTLINNGVITEIEKVTFIIVFIPLNLD